MMNNKTSFLIVIIAVVTMSSCMVTTEFKTSERKLNRQAEANANNARLLNKPIVAELDISMKRETVIYRTTNVEITNSSFSQGSKGNKSTLLFSKNEYLKSEAQKRAQFHFMDSVKCDYLIDPIYKTDMQSVSNSNLINITIEVSAFPAKYKKLYQPDSLPKSITEAQSLTGREIPLMINTSTSEKKAVNKTSGFMFGPAINKSNSLGEYEYEIYGTPSKIEDKYAKSGIGGSIGFYTHYPISKVVGIRTEYLLTTRAFKTEQNSGGLSLETSEREIGLDFPILLDFTLGNSFHIQAGPSINSSILQFSKIKSNNPFQPIDEKDSRSDIKINTGIKLGLMLESKGGFGIGLRQQLGMGKYSWSETALLLNFRFNK